LLSKSVVVLAPEIEVPLSGHRQSGWTEYLVLGAIHQLRLNKQPIITLDRSSIKAQDVRQLAEERPAGVIVIGDPVIEEPVLRAAAKMRLSGVPVVVYGDSAEVAGFHRVASDHAQGSYDLTRWLIERGCRRILEFWPAPANSYWFTRRHEGYERAMREAQLEALPPCLHPSYEPALNDNERFQKAIRVVAGYLAEHLSRNPVHAIMAATDGNVSVIAGACRLLGKEPNKDVLIVGYDHYWEDTLERQLEPSVPLATVDKRNPEMGAAMVQMVNECIAGRMDDSPQCRMLAPRLVEH
jgi:DNA-binding LacI/PurR family transcriptional regulator